MRELEVIMGEDKLNSVWAADEKEFNANHLYIVKRDNDELGKIQFQKGPRKEENSIAGVTESDLLEIVRDRLTDFQNSEFACKENENALANVNMALDWLYERVLARKERGILGVNKK